MTIWRGIFKLEPGHMLRYSLKTRQARIERFWQPNFTPNGLDSGRDYALEFERQFLAAVECHLAAPGVPLGLFLSGGLDSASICAATVELGYRNVHTFSIGQGGGPNDELPLARLVSDKFRTHHHEIIVTRQLYFDQLDEVAWHFDEPYGETPAVRCCYWRARQAGMYG
jgi:asparagine synthase (glutamine-hydrolysing)